jgi:hypothetical protein
VLEALTSREVRDVIKMVGDDEYGRVRPAIHEAMENRLALSAGAGRKQAAL